MNPWGDKAITQKGLALQAKLIEGVPLKITRIVAGSGRVPTVSLPLQTAVSEPKMELPAQAVSYPEEGKALVPVVLSNDGVTEAFICWQIGYYAEDPDEGEILYLLAQAAEESGGELIPAAEEMPGFVAEWDFVFQYGNASGVEITLEPAGNWNKADRDLANVEDDVLRQRIAGLQLIVIGPTEPEGPAWWFDTREPKKPPEQMILDLGTAEEEIVGVGVAVDDITYPVENAGVNITPTDDMYSFDIIE